MSDPMLGEISMFAGTFAPAGWKLCDGQLLEIGEFDALFTLIGTLYGGDGKRTFALPDLRSRVPLHAGRPPQLPEVQVGQSGGRVPPGGPHATDYSAGPYLGVTFIIATQGIFPSQS
ncbi:MAG: hypothetical protein QOI73_334 [Solirubrobacteraceae bacterium]|jgi:microcystin-dependent protein|nr:hypothetical protein [Solirubrobacteraceae bacterium]